MLVWLIFLPSGIPALVLVLCSNAEYSLPQKYPWGKVNIDPKQQAAVHHPVHSKVEIKGNGSSSVPGNTCFDPLLAWPPFDLMISNKGLCSHCQTSGRCQMSTNSKVWRQGRMGRNHLRGTETICPVKEKTGLKKKYLITLSELFYYTGYFLEYIFSSLIKSCQQYFCQQ